MATASRVLVLDPAGAGPLSLAQRRLVVDRLSALLGQSAGGRTPLSVLSSDELRALLSVEAQKQLMGCTDDRCLTELADAAGARVVVTSAVAAVAGGVVVTFAVIDAVAAAPIARQELRGPDAEAVLAALPNTAALLRRAALQHIGVVVSDGAAWMAFQQRQPKTTQDRPR